MVLEKDANYKKILADLDKLKQEDFSFSGGRILGSMCAMPHPIAKEAYIKFLETNLGDPELFPGTKKIETKLIKFISILLSAPKNSEGQIVSGGTEGNLTAMWIAKNKTQKNEIIVPESAHFSFKKISSLMGVKLVNMPVNEKYVFNINNLKKKINNDTMAVLGIAGSTELGTIDPIPDLSDICYDENIFLHIDAAFGGFVIPFLKELNYEVPDFDFKLKGVCSISIDAHKMGYSAIPLGVLVFRDGKWLDEISVESPYISVDKHSGMLGTRSGGPVAAAYATTKYLGLKGYKDLVKNCMDVTEYAENKIKDMGLELIIEPTMNVLAIKLKNLSKIVNILNKRGWRVNKISRLSCIRIVIMPQISKKIIDDFIIEFKKVCKEVGEL